MYEKLKDTASLVRLYVEGHHWDEVSTLCVRVCVYCACLFVCVCVCLSVCLSDCNITVTQAFNVVKKQGEYKVTISMQNCIHVHEQ